MTRPERAPRGALKRATAAPADRHRPLGLGTLAARADPLYLSPKRRLSRHGFSWLGAIFERGRRREEPPGLSVGLLLRMAASQGERAPPDSA